MSDDPERKGISRLDEIMSGVVRSILDRVACLLYSYDIYVLQIVGATPQSSSAILSGLFMLSGFIVSWRSR